MRFSADVAVAVLRQPHVVVCRRITALAEPAALGDGWGTLRRGLGGLAMATLLRKDQRSPKASVRDSCSGIMLRLSTAAVRGGGAVVRHLRKQIGEFHIFGGIITNQRRKSS